MYKRSFAHCYTTPPGIILLSFFVSHFSCVLTVLHFVLHPNELLCGPLIADYDFADIQISLCGSLAQLRSMFTCGVYVWP